MTDRDTREEVETARRYFSSFPDDYQRAFSGRGRQVLQGTVNRLFRRKTFQRRTEVIGRLLERHGLAGKTVLDLGCGSGEVSLLAARLGARVRGIDIVDRMIALARESAKSEAPAGQVEFQVGDIVEMPLETVDVTLLVGVVEYYRDFQTLLERAARVTRELIIVADTRGPWWRRALRHGLARLKRFNLYYRPPDRLSTVLAQAGFEERERILGHSFTVLAYRPTTGEPPAGRRSGASNRAEQTGAD